MTALVRRTGMLAAASLLGVGLVGVGAAPAFAATVSDTATLNAAINANETVLDISADFTLTAAIETIDYDVTINGNGHTIDADGFDAFDIEGSATVSNLTVTNADWEAFALTLSQDTGTFTNVAASDAEYGIAADLQDGATLTVTGGTFSALGNGVYLDDNFGNASVAVSGATLLDVGYGVYMGDAIGTTSLAVTGVKITDAYFGVYFYGEDVSSLTVSASTIAAGLENNNGGVGTGIFSTHYDESTAAIDGVTVSGGPTDSRFFSGYSGEQYEDSTVVLTNSTFTGNHQGVTVDVHPDMDAERASFALLNSRVTNNLYFGVSFGNLAGTALIDQTTIDNNGGDLAPGVVATVSDEGTGGLTISRSTVSNTVAGRAVEIALVYEGSSATVVNSTVSDNTTDNASTIRVEGDGSDDQLFRLLNSTITANIDSWAALELWEVDAVVSHSILSANDLSEESPAELVVQEASSLFMEWSLVGSLAVAPGSDYSGGIGVKETSAPGLGPLADNGGPTLTHALLAGSPALNAGNPAIIDPPTTDQRGDARVVQGRIDIGAVEMPAALAATGSTPAPMLPVALLLVLLGGALLVTRRRAA